MTITGYVLKYKKNNTIVDKFTTIPLRVDLPTGDAVFNIKEGWSDDNFSFEAYSWELPTPPTVPSLIPKRVIVDRLYGANLLEKARVALDAADLYTRERWNSRDAIQSNDSDAIALLKAIGANPEEILAPE